MLSPLERINKVIGAYTPSKVVFGATKSSRGILFQSVIVKDAQWAETDDPKLQSVLRESIYEAWNDEAGKYVANADADGIWISMKRAVLQQYDKVSDRCDATKRKTELFVRDIAIDNKHLANFIMQMFLVIKSDQYTTMTQQQRKDYFEQLEPLRRTYGKRK